MGLDWMLDKRIPKPDVSKKKYDELLKEAKDADNEGDEKKLEELNKQIDDMSICCWDVIQAPKVGIDKEATDWFFEEVYKPNQEVVDREKKMPEDSMGGRNKAFIEFWDRPFDAVLKDSHGKYVGQLAKVREGLASVTGFMMVSSVDFRGKVIGQTDWLDEDLKNEAYEDHTAKQCLDYADRLEKFLKDYRDDPIPDEEHQAETKYVRDAIKWLRFWGEKGFGYHAWY